VYLALLEAVFLTVNVMMDISITALFVNHVIRSVQHAIITPVNAYLAVIPIVLLAMQMRLADLVL